jgi:uncharacterized LabA/DUF88 family protein
MKEEKSSDRAIVFIDGNNLYHRLKERGWKTWIDIGKLAQKVVGQRTLVHIYYYNAPPPGGKLHTKRGNDYLAQVQKTPNLTFRTSWLQPIQKVDEYGSYQSYQEKGGDTALSTDLVSTAADNKFDVAVIVSSDGDYSPAACTVRDNYGKCVEVIYFEGRRPFAMESCSLMRAFRHSFIEEEYKRPSRRPGRQQRRR